MTEKLILLGFSGAYLPIISELANNNFGCKKFDVIKNIDVDLPGYKFEPDEYQFEYYMHDEYDFESNADSPVFFGVLHSHIKYKLYQFFKKTYGIGKDRYCNLIHPKSYLSKNVDFKNGVDIGPMTVSYPFIQLGFGVSVKRNSSLGEQNTLEDFVCINPGVSVSGFVTVGEGTEISAGASVVHNVKIGKQCLIGAGSVVTKDIPDGVIAYENPCRVIRKNERWENTVNQI